MEPQTDDFDTYELLGETFIKNKRGYIKYAKYPSILGRYVSIQVTDLRNMAVCDVIVLADD